MKLKANRIYSAVEDRGTEVPAVMGHLSDINASQQWTQKIRTWAKKFSLLRNVSSSRFPTGVQGITCTSNNKS